MRWTPPVGGTLARRVQKPPVQRGLNPRDLLVRLSVVAVGDPERVDQPRGEADPGGVEQVQHHTHVGQQLRVESREITQGPLACGLRQRLVARANVAFEAGPCLATLDCRVTERQVKGQQQERTDPFDGLGPDLLVHLGGRALDGRAGRLLEGLDRPSDVRLRDRGQLVPLDSTRDLSVAPFAAPVERLGVGVGVQFRLACVYQKCYGRVGVVLLDDAEDRVRGHPDSILDNHQYVPVGPVDGFAQRVPALEGRTCLVAVPIQYRAGFRTPVPGDGNLLAEGALAGPSPADDESIVPAAERRQQFLGGVLVAVAVASGRNPGVDVGQRERRPPGGFRGRRSPLEVQR